MVAETITRKKTHETVREKLLKSLKENDAVEEQVLGIPGMINPEKAITVINCCEEVIKTQNKIIIV